MGLLLTGYCAAPDNMRRARPARADGRWRLPGHGNTHHASVSDDFVMEWMNRSKSLYQQFYSGDAGQELLRQHQPGLYYTLL
jgi:hypothetical protein